MAPITKAMLRKAKSTLRKGNYGPRRNIRTISKVRLPGSYNFSRYANSTIGTALSFTMSNLVTENPYNFVFSLSRVQGYSDFTNLFDMYQIAKVDLYFRLVMNPDNTASGNPPNTYYPCLWFIRDYDDDTPGGLSVIRERQGVKRLVLRPTVIHKVSVVPKFQKSIYVTPTAQGYGPATGYLDCEDFNIPHYGLKTVLEAPTTGASWIVECQAKYHLTFKHPE